MVFKGNLQTALVLESDIMEVFKALFETFLGVLMLVGLASSLSGPHPTHLVGIDCQEGVTDLGVVALKAPSWLFVGLSLCDFSPG